MASSINRTRISLNVVVQAISLLAIVVMLNVFAFNHYKRWDLSRDQKYALSEQTRRVVENLKTPVQFIVFFTGQSDIGGDLKTLLTEYGYLSKKNISVEIVDPFLNLARAREVATKYKLGANENVVIVDYNGQSKVVNASDMAEYEPSFSPLEPPRLKAFKGEQVLTRAIMELTEQGANHIFAVAGHGEVAVNSPEFADLKDLIERQNIVLEPLTLGDLDAIPEKAQTLLIIGPKYDFSDHDLKLIKAYWEKKGRLFVFLDPNAETPKLLEFLKEVGITANDDRVLRTVPLGNITGVLKEITADFLPDSPVTKRLSNVSTAIMGGTQSLSLDADRVRPEHIRLTPLMRASKGFWAEKDHQISAGKSIFFDPKEDTPTPVVAASAERGGLSDDRVQLDTARLIVVGNVGMLDRASLTIPAVDFVLAGINWLIDREQLIAITPKTVRNFSLNLSDAQISSLATLTMGVIPGAAALIGLFVWFKRRR